MASGFQVGHACYPTALAAAQAYASAIPPQVVTTSSTCQFWSNHLAAGSADSPVLYVTYTKIPSTNCPVVPMASVPYVGVPCSVTDPFNLSYADAALVTSAVLSCWLSAYAFRAVRSVLKDRDNE